MSTCVAFAESRDFRRPPCPGHLSNGEGYLVCFAVEVCFGKGNSLHEGHTDHTRKLWTLTCDRRYTAVQHCFWCLVRLTTHLKSYDMMYHTLFHRYSGFCEKLLRHSHDWVIGRGLGHLRSIWPAAKTVRNRGVGEEDQRQTCRVVSCRVARRRKKGERKVN